MSWAAPYRRFQQQQEQQWRAAVRILLLNETPPALPYERELLSLSGTLITENRPELAVIVAQMACEVVVEQLLIPMLKGQRPWNFNVDNKVVRKLYIKHTHDPISGAPFWVAYHAHAERRHKVVHGGQRVSTAEARESLTAATQFVDYVESVRRSLASPTP